MESLRSSFVVAVLVFLAALAALAPATEACNGFRLVVKKAETKCADGTPSLLVAKDLAVQLTPDCKFVPSGCITATKPFNEANVAYTVKTSLGATLAEGTSNACKSMEDAGSNKDAAMVLNMFQLPTSCPVEAMERCADGKVVDIGPFKDKLMPGSIKVEAIISHEDGMKSCVVFEGALKK